jgi:hypothetical protein
VQEPVFGPTDLVSESRLDLISDAGQIAVVSDAGFADERSDFFVGRRQDQRIPRALGEPEELRSECLGPRFTVSRRAVPEGSRLQEGHRELVCPGARHFAPEHGFDPREYPSSEGKQGVQAVRQPMRVAGANQQVRRSVALGSARGQELRQTHRAPMLVFFMARAPPGP